MTGPLQIPIPITKIDAARREVWGVFLAERPDKTNEILDYATSKPYIQAWSDEFRQVTNGLSLGNLRVMHNPKIAAGKLIAIHFNDEAKQVEIGAKVVDDAEWRKVEEGVYTGFSVGGNTVGPMWRDPATGMKRYTINPIEATLADNPCIPGATFTVVKVDGTEEIRKFVTTEAHMDEEVTNAAEGEVEKTDEVVEETAAADTEKALSPEDKAGEGIDDKKDEIGEGIDKTAVAALTQEVADLRAQVTSLVEKMASAGDSELVNKVAAAETRLGEANAEVQKAWTVVRKQGTALEQVNKLVATQGEELTKAAGTISGLEGRLAEVEKTLDATDPRGPVLSGQAAEQYMRQIGARPINKALVSEAIEAQGESTPEAVYKSLVALQERTTDPVVKQAIGQELAEMAIKAAFR